MTQPFDDDCVLFRFEPMEEGQFVIGYISGAQEFVVVKDEHSPYGLKVWFLSSGKWHPDFAAHPVLARLLKELDQAWSALETQRCEWRAAREKVEAERDRYRTALQDFTQRKFPRMQYGYNSWELVESTQVVFCEALEQGEKIREGK